MSTMLASSSFQVTLLVGLFVSSQVIGDQIKTGRLLGITTNSQAPYVNGVWRIKVDDGQASLLSEFDVSPSGGDLVVGPDGTIYAAFIGTIDELVMIDSETYEVTYIGGFGFDAVSALAFSWDGVLYGFDSASCQLITIDPQTGSGTAIGPTG